jgi:hypothetical protein
MEQQVTHARHRDTTNLPGVPFKPGETLCGKKTGRSLDGWSRTAEEITCPDCNAKIPRYTLDELNAAVGPVLQQLQ